MTTDQFDTILAWFTRIDMRIEAIDRRLAAIERGPTINGTAHGPVYALAVVQRAEERG